MKKTHLYGAMAATMLLAPVTANVLAAEEGEAPLETLETQNSEELTEQPVLPSNEENPGMEGLSDEAGVSQGDIEQDDGGMGEVPEEDAGNFYGKDPAEEDGEEVEIPEEEGKTDNEVWTEEEKEVITIPAEEMYIPDPVTLDEEIDIRINYETSDIGTLNTWMESLDGIKVAVHERGTSEKVYEKNFSIDLSKFDMSHLSELQFFNGEFYSYFYYDMNDILATIEKESKLELNGDDDRILSLSLNYDHLNKKWKLNNHHAMDDNFTCLSKHITITSPTYSVFDYYPDLGQATEEDLDDEKIIHDFYNSFQSFVITLDGEEFSQVELTRDDFVIIKSDSIETIPERATGVYIPNSVTIRIDTNALAEKLNLPKNLYYHISSKHQLEGIRPTTMYSLTDCREITMYFTTSGNWKIAYGLDSNSNLKIDYGIFGIAKYQKEMDLLTNALKVHIYDISDQNKVTEFEYVPQNGDIYDNIEFTKTGNLVSGERHVRINSNEYLKKYEELKNGKYKFAIPQSEYLYEHLAYNSTSYSNQTELVIYVEKDTLSENQYSNNGVQLSAKSNEDLYGLEFKAENTKSDNNFGFDSTNETVGYTLSFVNRQGEEVQRTGSFEVQMPIPTEWAGKVLKVYQVDQTGNKELLSILMDGKVIFTPTTLSTFVLVKEAEQEEKETVFESENYYVLAQSPSGFRDVQIKMEEAKSEDNFGYSDQYDTYGYHLYLVDKNGNPINREGSFYGWFKFPEEFNMRVLSGKMINATTNEVIWEEDMGWYRLEEIGFDEENLNFIFVAAEKKKEEQKPEEPEPETPIKTEATFTQDGYQVKAESKEDLTGLQIVIDEVEADNNFGLSSDYQTIGYDIHFENEEGTEVSRTGKFTVRIPIPTKFIGKEVRLFHKENKESDATELQFKIIDGKYYEFETTSFSWFIVASQTTNTEPNTPSNPEQPTQPDEEKPEQPKPSDPIEQPTTPADEANKPQEKPIDTTVKPTTNNQTIKVVQVKAEETKQTEESDTKHSPNTGIAVHKTSSMFISLMSILGLGFLTGKRRKF